MICSCAKNSYKSKLVPNGRVKTLKNPYGSYMRLMSESGVIEGEFIAFTDDQVYVMTHSEIVRINSLDIRNFQIVLAENRSKAYAIGAGFALVPAIGGAALYNDYRGLFLLRGFITGAFGLLAALLESSRESAILAYPGDGLEIVSYCQYARFPAGIPQNLSRDTSELFASLKD